ncbi:hypothetical protein PVAG01_07561 [Phlyctema vagabunda]|uniref:DUF6590 domain-containing protein n=1 Tax=Phlyctema vagabunda TaxID=108571 RepID=A0ABR4PDJ7_9HELO
MVHKKYRKTVGTRKVSQRMKLSNLPINHVASGHPLASGSLHRLPLSQSSSDITSTASTDNTNDEGGTGFNDHFRVRRNDYRSFFRSGRIFKIPWTGGATRDGEDNGGCISDVRFGQSACSRLMTFIVIRLDMESCLCLSLLDQDLVTDAIRLGGTSNFGYNQQRAAFSGKNIAVRHKTGKTLFFDNLEINYHRPYTVEMNLRVIDFGQVEAHSLRGIQNEFRESMDSSTLMSNKSQFSVLPPPTYTPAFTGTNVPRLYKKYKEADRPSQFFTLGRVFKVPWTEPATAIEDKGNHHPNSLSSVGYGVDAFTKIRPFVVIREGENFSICLRMHSYGGRGAQKHRFYQKEHIDAYPSMQQPPVVPLWGREPVPVSIEDPAEMKDSSLINFAKLYTVPHNVQKVNVGIIPDAHIEKLKSYSLERLPNT